MIAQALIPFFAALSSFGPVDGWDLGILQWIQAHLANPFFDAVMPVLSFLADKGWFMILAAVVLIIIPRTRKIGFTMGVALLLGLIFGNGILKNLIARTRPYDLYPALYAPGGPLRLLVHAESDLSFPSGHTLASFEAAVGLFLWNKKWGSGALALAFLIAFSRLYVSVHYVTDVIAGAILGTCFALLAKFIVDRVAARIESAKQKKAALSAEKTEE
ncbi:MAG: phosphatase PAP2 family protein [Clostridia bacterium]|nr:phosphatase PAP2 family protein [Clostridia bacterium]